ncbi:MAG: AraC family transcriptional regulator [Opitutaceae bacterium]
MSSLQFWEHSPRLKYSVVMPRPVKADHRFHDHSHDFFELSLVLEGECTWKIGRRSVHLSRGDALLVPPHINHYEKVPEDKVARIAWVGFEFEAAPRVPPALLGPLPAGRHSSELQALLQLIYSEHQSSELGSAERAKLVLREVLIVLCRALDQPKSDGQEPPSARMSLRQSQIARSAARYLTENLARPLSVREVARYHSLCTPHFSAVFRRYHGLSPQRFLHHARIAHAKALVSAGELTIKEIAAICGYVDAAHFCRRFKETTGVTPKQYRVTQPSPDEERSAPSARAVPTT